MSEDTDREILTTKPRRKNPLQQRAELAQRDYEQLFLEEHFKRFLFTFFSLAGMFDADFHSDGRIHAWSAGRRSLGLDILRTAEKYLGPDALLRVLEAEKKTQIGGPLVPRNEPDPDAEPRAEPGSGSGPQYLDYGPVRS